MHYKETRTDNGRTVRLTMPKRLELLEEDMDEAIIATTLPNANELCNYIHTLQVIGNIVRKLRRELLDKLEIFKSARDDMQRAIAGANFLVDPDGKRYSDSGNQRKAMSQLVTATWGPINIIQEREDGTQEICLSGPVGIKKALPTVNKKTALQLAAHLVPGVDEESVPVVEHSFDDLCRMGELNLKNLESIEHDLESRNYATNHIAKMIEIENFEARRASREGTSQ